MLGLALTSAADAAHGAGVTYTAEATALFARMDTDPGATRKALYDTMIASLKTAGVWAKLELLYLLAAHSRTTAKLNLIEAAHNLAELGTPGFTVDRGFAPAVVNTDALDTGLAPSAAVLATLNSCSLGAWSISGTDAALNTTSTIGSQDATNGFFLTPRRTSGHLGGRCNSAGSGESPGAAASQLGFSALSRTASNLVSYYRGTTVDGTTATVSSARNALSIYVLAQHGASGIVNGADHRVAFGFVGAGLSDAEVLALYNAVHVFLVGVGAAA